VIDDDAVAREGMRAILAREGYTVALAGNGREALDYLAGNLRTALILLDMLMPVMDGWQVLEFLRKDSRLAGIPVILMSVGITTREWALAHGCTGYICKPIDVDELLREVRRCTGSSLDVSATSRETTA